MIKISKCLYCGKDIYSPAVRKFCNRDCDSNYKKGRKIGSYDSTRIEAMVKGKNSEYLRKKKFLLKDNYKEILSRYIEYNYISKLRFLAPHIMRDGKSSKVNVKLTKKILIELGLWVAFGNTPLYEDAFQKLPLDVLVEYTKKIKEVISRNYVSDLSYLSEKIFSSENKFTRPVKLKILRDLLRKEDLENIFKSTPSYNGSYQKLSITKFDEFIKILETDTWIGIKKWCCEQTPCVNFRGEVFGPFWEGTKDTIDYFDKRINIITLEDGKKVKTYAHGFAGTLPERIFEDIAKKNGWRYIPQYPIPQKNDDFSLLFHYDFFVEDKILVEIHGDYWHSLEKSILQDERKKKRAEEINIPLLVYWESFIYNKENTLLIEEEIKRLLNE